VTKLRKAATLSPLTSILPSLIHISVDPSRRANFSCPASSARRWSPLLRNTQPQGARLNPSLPRAGHTLPLFLFSPRRDIQCPTRKCTSCLDFRPGLSRDDRAASGMRRLARSESAIAKRSRISPTCPNETTLPRRILSPGQALSTDR